MNKTRAPMLTLGALLCLWTHGTTAQDLTTATVSGALSERRSLATPDHPSVGYSVEPFGDAVAELNRRLEGGSVRLAYDADTGYLRSVLEALNLSPKSQLLVYSKTSLQAPRISPSNPRALYFSDNVVVGYIRGAPLLEFAVLDSKRGIEFYTLPQRESQTPRLARGTDCLRCHESLASLDVPGMLLRSVPTGPDGGIFPQLGNYVTDHRSPVDQRWGGWYVTGSIERAEHMGNVLLRNPQDETARVTTNEHLTSLETRFDQRGYLTPLSDVAALLVFEHQMRMSNLLVRIGWDARFALSLTASATNQSLTRTLLDNNARELVDYLLFVEEAPLPGAVGGSAFASEFESRGPFDKKGRSLRNLDLTRRLLRYPCSYMIYSDSFEALPSEAKDAIYKRLWAVLSGKESDPAYRKLSAADRRAVIEILRDTKPGLPEYFRDAES